MTVPKLSPRSSCQDGITLGTTSAASASASTIGAARVPRRATLIAVRYRHITNAAARANGSSATNSAKQMPYSVQNRGELPSGPPAMSEEISDGEGDEDRVAGERGTPALFVATD